MTRVPDYRYMDTAASSASPLSSSLPAAVGQGNLVVVADRTAHPLMNVVLPQIETVLREHGPMLAHRRQL